MNSNKKQTRKIKLKSKQTFRFLEEYAVNHIFNNNLWHLKEESEFEEIGKICFKKLKRKYIVQKLTVYEFREISRDAFEQAKCRRIRKTWKT